ncbi:hypothetical protein [Lacimicrobium sp. SS2-24]|uniref:hypothetical protein n=1 Tax=Lacimicrobium sp. SS2-24 TaxID=2005569 RepID=UPI001130F29E|nr:hypothetical protein [Lacimicrobium sp. SS2-24]
MRIAEVRPQTWTEAMAMGIGLIFLLLALYGIVYFPIFNEAILVFSALYLLVLQRYPLSWLLVFPIVGISLDLTQSSGRFLISEWDFLIWLTIGWFWFRRDVHFPSWGVHRWAWMLAGAYIALSAWQSHIWQLLSYIDSSQWHNPYYLEVYGAKLAKSLLWAALLLPVVLQQRNTQQAFSHWLVTGVAAACFVMFITILWERGVLSVLFNQGFGYGFINTLLDSSSSYRTTGLFSEMHTGGEVIDGVIVLSLPIVLWGLTLKSGLLKALSAGALICLLYVTFVGFTRTTYVAVFLSIILFLSLYLKNSCFFTRENLKPWLMPALLFLMTLFMAIQVTGNVGIAILMMTLLGAAMVMLLTDSFWVKRLLLALGIGFAIYQLIINHFNHKWIEVEASSIAILTAACVLVPVSTLLLAERLRRLPAKQLFIAIIVLGPALVLTKQMFGGYQMGSRLENISEDLNTRFSHWSRVLASGDQSAKTLIFGNGVGSFPRNYLLHNPESLKETGSFDIQRSAGGGVMLLGGGHDMAVAQRVAIHPGTQLRVTARIHNPENARLGVYLCERNVIFASNTARQCSGAYFTNSESPQLNSEPSELSLTLTSGNVGKGTIFTSWPAFFHVKNYSAGTVVKIHELQLWLEGQPLLHNAEFAQGSDHWFFYNDFVHLPWHIKNTYLQWYYDQGIAGLLLLLSMFGVALIKAYRETPTASAAIFSGIVGVAIVGVFGTPLDSARVSLLFYLGLLSLIFIGKAETDTKHEQ